MFPFGEPWSLPVASDNDQNFTTYQRDDANGEAGLDYAVARYYASRSGRFMTPDPEHIGANVGDPQSWNAYVYVSNDSINSIDPTGLFISTVEDPDNSTGIGNFQPCTPIYVDGILWGSTPGCSTGTGPSSPATPVSQPVSPPSVNPRNVCTAGVVGTAIAGMALGAQVGGGIGLLTGPGEAVIIPFSALITGGMALYGAAGINHCMGMSGNSGAGNGGGKGPSSTDTANKIHHIFSQTRHKLRVLVQKLGSEEAAYKAVVEATEVAAKTRHLAGVFETVVQVGGQNVVVRGNVINGIVKIGTFFIR